MPLAKASLEGRPRSRLRGDPLATWGHHPSPVLRSTRSPAFARLQRQRRPERDGGSFDPPVWGSHEAGFVGHPAPGRCRDRPSGCGPPSWRRSGGRPPAAGWPATAPTWGPRRAGTPAASSRPGPHPYGAPHEAGLGTPSERAPMGNPRGAPLRAIVLEGCHRPGRPMGGGTPAVGPGAEAAQELGYVSDQVIVDLGGSTTMVVTVASRSRARSCRRFPLNAEPISVTIRPTSRPSWTAQVGTRAT